MFTISKQVIPSKLLCRLVCLRIHPTFHLLHPSESLVSFTSIDGSTHEVFPDGGEKIFEGRLIPNGNGHFILFFE
jgi:alpha-glucosidase